MTSRDPRWNMTDVLFMFFLAALGSALVGLMALGVYLDHGGHAAETWAVSAFLIAFFCLGGWAMAWWLKREGDRSWERAKWGRAHGK